MAAKKILQGRVIMGLKKARTLGFPTLNINAKNAAKLGSGKKAFGVFAVWVKTSVGEFPGALHYGPRFHHKGGLVCEVHCIGLNKNLYRKKIVITVIKKLRASKSFSSLEKLKKAIALDVKKTAILLT